MTFVPRRYGLPFKGYTSSMMRHLAPPDMLTEDSRDCIVEPLTGRGMGRWGSRIIGEATVTAQAGLLESAWSAKSRQIQSLNSPSMDNGDPVPSCLYTSEASTTARFGTLYARSSDSSGANYQLGLEYSNGNSYPDRYKVVPIPYQSGTAFGLTRGTSATLRKFMSSGSRSFVQGNSQALLPGLYSRGVKWNRRWNDSTTLGSEINRIYPWGQIPPLFPPTVGSAVASASQNDRNFRDGDAWVTSVIFEDENGQWSMPFTPRPATVTNSGYVTVGTVRTGTGTALVAYSSVTVSNVAIGPPGTRRRLVIRTNKVNLSAVTQTTSDGILRGGGQRADEIDVHPERWFVWAIIEDNTATSISVDSGGDQSGVPDPRIRFDTVWPRPARYAFELEGRIAVGYTRYHPDVIILAPTGKVASRDLNASDTAHETTAAFAYRLDAANLVLQYYATFPGAPAETAIPITSTTTVQALIDLINATTVSSTAKEWAAQLVPGADPTALVISQLSLTRFSGVYAVSGATLTYISGYRPADAAVGMEVKETGVATRRTISAVDDTAGTITTSGNLAAHAGITVYFGPDVNDNSLDSSGDDETIGIVRVFNAAYPGIIPFRYSYLSSLIGYEDKQELYFTSRSPEQATATETFMIGNVRKPPASDNAGVLMGGAPLPLGGVVCFSKAIYTFENRREGGTGADEDYQLHPLNLGRGCIAPGSIVHGNGWVGYVTPDGYVVTDGKREVLITGDIYDPGTKRGNLDQEIQASFASAEDDTDASTFYAALNGTQLSISYSKTGYGDDNAARQVYDFSESIESSGLAEVLRGDGSPYPWSPPYEQKVGPMGVVVHTDQFSSNGPHFYGETQQNPGSTGDGEIIQLDMDGILYDESNEETVSCTWSDASTTLTAAAGSFASVAVGAKVKHADLDSGNQVTVTAKASDQFSVTISAASTDPGTAVSLTFKGKEIEPRWDMATDFVDTVRHDKAFHNAKCIYKSTAGTMTVQFSRDKNRTSSRDYVLENSSDDFHDYDLRLEQRSRAPTIVGEFRVHHDGRGTVRPEWWGMEAEVEILTQDGG